MRERIRHYRIKGEIGRGAMGRVYLAQDEVIKRNVAIKELVLPHNITEEEKEEAYERFKREARAAGGLSHPNIVTIYSVEEEDGIPFIVMEYLEGTTLHEKIEEGPIGPEKTADIISQVCEALSYSHNKDIVHRDIKPDNIFLLFDGTVKLTDFGIAKVMSSSTMTRVGMVIGSPGYMSPEQVRGGATDWRTDVFATGVLLYEMLTGVNPFASDSPTSVMYKIVHEEPQPIEASDPSFPPYLQEVIDKALAKDKDHRYQDISQMNKDLVEKGADTGAAGAAATTIVPAAAAGTVMVDRTGEKPAPATQIVQPPSVQVAPTQEPAPEPLIPPPEPSKSKRKIWLIAALCVLVIAGVVTAVLLIPGGTQVMTWAEAFGGQDSDQATSVLQTDDGGYAMAGLTSSFGSGGTDAWLVKTDAEGKLIWSSTFGGEKDDVALCMHKTDDGGYILAGCTESEGEGGKDAWLVKAGSEGDTLWSGTFGGEKDDAAESVQQTDDGGYILAGWTESEGEGGKDAWLAKTDASGNLVWSETMGGEKDDAASSVIQTANPGYVLAGWTQSTDSGNSDAWLVKTGSSGNIEWEHTYGGDAADRAASLLQCRDGSFILAGTSESYGSGGEDAWLIKTDAQGKYRWSEVYGGTDNDRAYCVRQTSDGGYILAGWTESSGSGTSDAWLVKTDSGANMAWDHTFGGSMSDGSSYVGLTNDGGYILAGWTGSYSRDGKDAWLVKTDPDGKVAGLEEGRAEGSSGEDEDKGEDGPKVEAKPVPGSELPGTETQAETPAPPPQPAPPAPEPEPAPSPPPDDGYTQTDYDWGYNEGFGDGNYMGYNDYWSGAYNPDPYDVIGPNDEYIEGYIDGYREGYESGWYEAWSEDNEIYTPE